MTIPDEAVEVVARALAVSNGTERDFDARDVDGPYMRDARAALTAAEPYLRAKVAQPSVREPVSVTDSVTSTPGVTPAPAHVVTAEQSAS